MQRHPTVRPLSAGPNHSGCHPVVGYACFFACLLARPKWEIYQSEHREREFASFRRNCCGNSSRIDTFSANRTPREDFYAKANAMCPPPTALAPTPYCGALRDRDRIDGADFVADRSDRVAHGAERGGKGWGGVEWPVPAFHIEGNAGAASFFEPDEEGSHFQELSNSIILIL